MSDGFMINQYRNHWTGPQDRVPIAYRPVEGGFLAALFGGGAAAAQQVATAAEPAKPAARITEPRAAARPVEGQARFQQARPQRAEGSSAAAAAAAPAVKVTEPPIGGPPVNLTPEQFAAIAARGNPLAPPGTAPADVAARITQNLDRYEAQIRQNRERAAEAKP